MNPEGDFEVYKNGENIQAWLHEDAGTYNVTLRIRRGSADWHIGQVDDANLKFIDDLGEVGAARLPREVLRVVLEHDDLAIATQVQEEKALGTEHRGAGYVRGNQRRLALADVAQEHVEAGRRGLRYEAVGPHAEDHAVTVAADGARVATLVGGCEPAGVHLRVMCLSRVVQT